VVSSGRERQAFDVVVNPLPAPFRMRASCGAAYYSGPPRVFPSSGCSSLIELTRPAELLWNGKGNAVKHQDRCSQKGDLRRLQRQQVKLMSAAASYALRQWKLSPVDLLSRKCWFDYSRARDLMLKATDTTEAPWYILHSDDKKRARLNCLAHILELISYKKVKHEKVEMPKRSMKHPYDDQKSLEGRKFVAEKY